ncbi:MAG: sporulation protein YtfJ [Dehalococcoidia bacterium]|nr:sporulation protein YtfJ [Dehalococcoidia bacterium]
MQPAPTLRALESIPDHATVAACFGTPTTAGDRTVIPVAEVYYGFGFGWGSGSDAQTTSEGGGAGGGGGVRTRGVAVVELSPDGVRVIPIRDYTSIALAALTFASAATLIVARTLVKLRGG